MSVFGAQMKAGRNCQQSVTRGLDGAYAIAATCKTEDGAITPPRARSARLLHRREDAFRERHDRLFRRRAKHPQRHRHHHDLSGRLPLRHGDGDEIANGMKMNLLKTLAPRTRPNRPRLERTSRVSSARSRARVLESRHGVHARPNVVLVLTDDQAIRRSARTDTLHQDAGAGPLHADAVRFEQFHSGTTCAPTRRAS